MSVLSISQALKQWQELCADPRLSGLPYKFETNATGQIIMSPPKNRHSYLQCTVYDLLKSLAGSGRPVVEFVLLTNDGVKVPDVVWASADWMERHGDEDVATVSPEICVEIMSQSNSLSEMDQKMNLYFEKGCQEFFLVDMKGFVSFFGPSGQLDASALVPEFPRQVLLSSS